MHEFDVWHAFWSSGFGLMTLSLGFCPSKNQKFCQKFSPKLGAVSIQTSIRLKLTLSENLMNIVSSIHRIF